MKQPSQCATGLKTLINKAIIDLEVTPSEYQDIINMAHDDGVIDHEESALLAQFHEMISNGTVKRVRAYTK